MSEPALTRRRCSLALAASLLLAPFGCGEPAPDDWPQWRGVDSRGVSDRSALPTRWSATTANVRWRTELPGLGNSSAVAAGNRIYLTTAYRSDAVPESDGPEDMPDPLDEHLGDEEQVADEEPSERVRPDRQRAVLGLDRETGELLWHRRLFAAPPESKHRHNSFAAPTPVTDGESVVVYFGSTLAKLDPDGEVIWQHEIDPDYAKYSRYGAASSPVFSADAILVLQDKEFADSEEAGWLAAFDRETGERLWRTEWEHTCCSYTTPLVVDRGAGEEILVAHSGALTSYSASTGEPLWSYEVEILQMVGTPVLHGDLLLVAGGAYNVKGTFALQLVGSGTETTVKQVWSSRHFAPQNASPVVYRDQLFTVTDQGIMASYRVRTGELLWNHRLGHMHNRASLVAGDGKVYVSSTGGTVVVVAAEETFQLLAENDFDEPGTNASPAIVDGCLLVRTRAHLTCVERERDTGDRD
jgi:outer membrane protein assembly factor BamB